MSAENVFLNRLRKWLVPLLSLWLFTSCLPMNVRGVKRDNTLIAKESTVKKTAQVSIYEATKSEFEGSGVEAGTIIVETGVDDGPLLEPIEEDSLGGIDEASLLDPIEDDISIAYSYGNYPYKEGGISQKNDWLELEIDQGSLMYPIEDVDPLANWKKTALFYGFSGKILKHNLLGVEIEDGEMISDEEEEAAFAEEEKDLDEKILKELSEKRDRENLFPTPEGLREAVSFWTDIYGHYTSDQIVIHNKRHPEIIYTIVERSDYKKGHYSYRRMLKQRRKRVKEVKKKYRRILKKLDRKKNINPAQLTGEECRIYDLFLNIEDKDKFKKAANLRQIRAQVGQKDRFLKALEFSGLYRSRMEEIFREEGLPVQLTRLPFVESAFNTRAYSPAGASGIWQFIHSTGKLFMKINSLVDERRDPYKSTRAAAQLLRMNYNQLNNWPLAVTAYNHGNVGIKKAVTRMNTEDMGIIAQKYKGYRFGFASRNYYAQFIAANYVYEHAGEIFGEVNHRSLLKYDEVVLDSFISSKTIIKHCRLSVENFKEYNPELRASVFRYSRLLPKGYRLKLPPGTKDRFLKYYATASKMKVFKMAGYHQVEFGDTLSGIANMYRTKLRYLILLNNLEDENMIRVGRKLKIPQPKYNDKPKRSVKLASTSKVTRKSKRVKKPSGNKSPVVYQWEDGGFVKHRVRKGESLIYLARKYSVSVGDIRRYNSIDRKYRIYVGQILSIPMSSGHRLNKLASNNTGSNDMIDNPAGYNGDYLRVIVQKGDSLWGLAKEYGTTIKTLRKANNLKGHKLLFGKQLRIPLTNPAARKNIRTGKKTGTPLFGKIYVLPNESLGHLAKWSKTSARSLRRLNNFSFNQSIHEGQALNIDYRNISAMEFHRKRERFQKKYRNRYLRKYKIAKLKDHILKKDQNVWTLCQKVYKIPYWLVRKYNYGKNLAKLKVGDKIVVPIVSRRTKTAEVL